MQERIISNEEFKKRWQEHFAELERLKWNLPGSLDQEVLADCIKRLNNLLEIATKNRT